MQQAASGLQVWGGALSKGQGGRAKKAGKVPIASAREDISIGQSHFLSAHLMPCIVSQDE